jgi:hypothetical protein
MIIVFIFGLLPWMKASKKPSRERMVFGDATWLHFLNQVTQRQDIVFRFIIEYSILRNFGPK